MAVSFACPDWVDRLKAGRAPMPDLPIDPARAERAVRVFNGLRLPDVAGQPTLEDACGEWFRDILRACFGAIDPETGERAVGEAFVLVPKKNSKTTNSAALGLTALLLNETPNVEMLIVAPTKEVAGTCFGQAAGMIDADPEDPETGRRYLVDRFHVAHHTRTITDRVTGATLQIKAFDMRVVTGSIPVLCIIDEMHVLGASAHAKGVLAQIRGGMITRPDSLLLTITTQSDGPPAGVFKTELDYARRVRDGEIQGGNLLPVLYEFPEALQRDPDKGWRDPVHWPMVLPNLGRSITVPRLVRLYEAAREKGADDLLTWASQHLNIQVGIGLHNDRWIGADLWPARGDTALTLDRILETSDVVTAGIDGGGLDDLLGLAILGRHRDTRRWQAWGRAWAHPIALERRKAEAPRLRDFAAAGDLVICDDPSQDLREVAEILARINGLGLLPEAHAIGLDPIGIAALVDELNAKGLEGEQLSAIGQGFRLMPAITGAERKLQDGSLVHGDQDLMAWAVGNAKTEPRGNAVMISKAVAGRGKIDPLVALFNAVILMSRNPEAAGGAASPWDDPEFCY